MFGVVIFVEKLKFKSEAEVLVVDTFAGAVIESNNDNEEVGMTREIWYQHELIMRNYHALNKRIEGWLTSRIAKHNNNRIFGVKIKFEKFFVHFPSWKRFICNFPLYQGRKHEQKPVVQKQV